MAKKSFEGVKREVHPRSAHPVLAFVVGLGALGILIASGVYAFTQYRSYQQDQPISTFTVTGKASDEITSDSATLVFSLRRSGTNVSELNTALDEDINKVRAYLSSQEIGTSQIEINKNTAEDFRFPIDPPSPEQPSTPAQQNVEAVISVNFPQLSEVNSNEIISQVIALGAVDVRPLQFELSSKETRCDSLVNSAITDAKSKAENRLKALGGDTIVRTSVLESTSCSRGGYYPVAFAEDASVQSAPDILQNQEELDVSVVMEVEYR